MILSGALVVDKQPGVTSHDVVQSVRHLLNQKEVGHAGTLDPLATGVLVCLLGDATKLSQYVMSDEKNYEVGILLGVKTDTGDVTGKTIQQSDPKAITDEQIKEQVLKLTGNLELAVPKYSAVKVAGKKLYEYARKEEDVSLPVKTMVIHSVEIQLIDLPRVRVAMRCEKGTYVRSWVEKIGEELGCGATVEVLRRTKSGAFDIENAIKLSDLDVLSPEQRQQTLISKLIPMADVLSDWPQLKVIGREAVLLKNGQVPKGVFSQIISASVTAPGIRLISEESKLLAIAVKDPQKGVKLARVFNVC